MNTRTGSIRKTAVQGSLFLLAWLWLSLAVNLPNGLERFADPALIRLSPEIGVLFAGIALYAMVAARTPGRAMRWGLAGLVLLIAAVRAGDLASHTIIGRPVNLSLDLVLLPAITEVLTQSATPAQRLLAYVLAPVAILVPFALSALAIGHAGRVLSSRGGRRGFAAAVVMLAAVNAGAAALAPDGPRPFAPLAESAGAFVADHVSRVATAAEVRARSLEAFRTDRFADLPSEAVLTRLQGRDVYLFFFESYGRTVMDDPRYVPVIEPRLRAFEDALARSGFGVYSGSLVSPVVGGQSWLGHGTLLSGQVLSDQGLYTLLLTTQRKSLMHYFKDAGYRTVAAMPAMIRPWPEGSYWGYDTVYRTPDMNYAGPSFSWSPMPDQYTLKFIDDAERVGRTQPLFIEYALISSHGPWNPVPPLLDDWDEIGDGSIFLTRTATDLPYDQERADITQRYVNAVDYTLRTLQAYITRFIEDDALVIIVGDHQPAPLITGDGASRSVPMHVISRSPDLLRPFADWGFEAGMIVRGPEPHPHMAEFRDMFLEAFSPAPGS